MRNLLIAAACAALAAPVAAQAPVPPEPRIFHEELDEDLVRALPDPRTIEEVTYGLDRVLGAMMDIDIGPIADAADPWRRNPEHGRPGRTLREMGGRGDPYFEDRMRHSLYGATENMGRMMEAMAAATPALRRGLAEMERSIGEAVRAGRAGRDHDRRWDPRD